MKSYIKIYDATNFTTKAFDIPRDAKISVNDKLNDIAKFDAEIRNNSSNRALLSDHINDNLYICYNNPTINIDTPIYSNDTEIETHTIDYSLAQSLTVTDTIDDYLTLKFDAKKDLGASTTYVQVRQNGLIVNDTTIPIDATTYQTYDFIIPSITNGDVIELWVKTQSVIQRITTKNLRLYREYMLLKGKIDGENGITYVSRRIITISGYASFVELSRPLFLKITTPINPTKVLIEVDGTTYTDITSTLLDPDIGATIDLDAGIRVRLYIGYTEQFDVANIHYTQAAVFTGEVMWNTSTSMGFLDETNFLKRTPSTRMVILPETSNWVKQTINGSNLYWLGLFYTVTTATTNPIINSITLGIQDPAKITYTSEKAINIISDVIEKINNWAVGYNSTGNYTIAECPETLINLNINYEKCLNTIKKVAETLTWNDGSNNTYNYDWWIDDSNQIYIKDIRQENYTQATAYDLSANLTILSKRESYVINNRIFGIGEETSGLRRGVEDITSENTYNIRDKVLPDARFNDVTSFDSKLKNELRISKDPIYTYDCQMPFKLFNEISPRPEIGDWIKINQPEWNTNNVYARIIEYNIDFNIVRFVLSTALYRLPDDVNSIQSQITTLQTYTGGKETPTNKNVANGYAGIDVNKYINGSYPVIQSGLSTGGGRPSSGSYPGQMYFYTDNYVLSIWTGTVWAVVTLV